MMAGMSSALRLPSADTPFTNPLDGLLGYQLRRASAVMLADLSETLADLDLTVTEVSILLQIDANPDITQSDIGRILAIKRANMAPMTAALQERGFLDRVAADGRSQSLRLTERGRTICNEVRDRISRHEARFLPDISPAEREALIEMLALIWVG